MTDNGRYELKNNAGWGAIWRRFACWGMAGLVVVSVAMPISSAETARPSVAILQFSCSATDLAWAGKALPDLITTRLSGEAILQVLDRDFIQSVLTEQGLGANGFMAPGSLVVGKLRLADFLVFGEVATGAEEDILTLRIIRSATGTIEKTVTIKGKLPKAMDAMVESAAVAIAEITGGVKPAAVRNDFRLERVPESLESFYRGMEWCALRRPLRAAPHFLEAAKRDPQFVLARIRERQCYVRMGLPRLAEEAERALPGKTIELAGLPNSSNQTPAVILVRVSAGAGVDPAMVAEVRNAVEQAVTASGIRLAGRDAVVSRTDELDLTLGGKFEPKQVPAYRALVVATHALAVTLTPRADGEIMITGVLSDMFTGQARETGSEQVSVPRLVDAATSQTRRLCQATVATTAASVLTPEEAIGTSWKTPDDVFRDQQAVSEVDKAGLLLEMLMQRPWDREVFGRLVGDLPYGAQWWVEALSQTVLDRLQPESLEKAQMMVLLCSPGFRIQAGNKDMNRSRTGFRADDRTMKLFEEIAQRYPGTSVAADCQFRIGCWQRDRGEFEAAAISFGKAEAEYRQLMADTDSLCPVQFKSRFSTEERLRYEQSILKGYVLSCASMLYHQGLTWQESGKTEEASRAFAEAWMLADAYSISRAEVMRSAGVTKAGKTGKTVPASVYLEFDLRTAMAGAQAKFSDRFVAGAEAYVHSDFETAFDAWSEVATQAEHPVLVVMAGRNILLGMSFFSMERRQPVAEPFLCALPAALEQGRCLSLRDFEKAVSAAVYLLGEDPKQAAGMSQTLAKLEGVYAKHSPDDRRGPVTLARLYLDCRLYEDCIRLCDEVTRPGPAACPNPKYFWEVISLCAKAIRASKGVDAQLAYQKKWAGIKEPADAQLLGDIFFVEAVKGIADAFKAEGRIAEAAALYEKLTHAYENSPVPDNWKGIDPNWTLPVATMRFGCMMHWAECLEAMKDIDGAVFLYKRVARECDGRDIQRPDSQGPLDKVAGKRLEALRARQEQTRTSGESK